MKKISSEECSHISAGHYIKALAIAMMRTLDYGFNEWKRSRIEKYSRLDKEEAQLLILPPEKMPEEDFIVEQLAK